MDRIAEKNERSRKSEADPCQSRWDYRSITNQQSSLINSDGFTLIELLVVIAVIALLMAILLPTLQRVRRQAKAMICQARLRQWGVVLAAYAEDHRGRFPSTIKGADGMWLLRGAFLDGADPNALQDSFHHFRTQDIACCPMATSPRQVLAGGVPDFVSSGRGSFGSYQVTGTTGSAFTAWEIATPPRRFEAATGSTNGCSAGSTTPKISAPTWWFAESTWMSCPYGAEPIFRPCWMR